MLRVRYISFCLLLCFWSVSILGQENLAFQAIHFQSASVFSKQSEEGNYIYTARKRAEKANGSINLFVLNREKKFNLSSFGFRFNAFFAQLFDKKIQIVRVVSLADLVEQTNALMAIHSDKMIGHLWFDSHGKFKKGFSLFNIGIDTLTCQNIKDYENVAYLEQLTAYCDEKSQITIGSCYGAATYNRPANQLVSASPMLGDSLLLAMSSIFSLSPIYGSESWIMVKPFNFGKEKGLSGFPIERRFTDEIYRPAWQSIGSWKKVEPGTQKLIPVHTAYLGKSGSLEFNQSDYLSSVKNQKKVNRKMKKLKPGRYDMSGK
jgi:hypothetical protein